MDDYEPGVTSGVRFEYDAEGRETPPGLPEAPGVYIFKDGAGRVIYVGKAKHIRKRVQSYFKPSEGMPRKTALMMKNARSLDWILTDSENEAFILESTLIKKFLPRYNIILRDDKRYPCLRLDLQEPYPRLQIVRRIKKDGALYFGPFSSAHSVRSTLKVIDRIFQLRKCKEQRLPKRTRPCLNFQMDRCLGPCTRDVSPSLYRNVVRQVRLFLEGRDQELITQLKKEMGGAAQNLDFERAARIRDQIRAIERTVERQNVVSSRLDDKDVIGVAGEKSMIRVALLFVRRGYLMGSRHFLFRNQAGRPAEVLEAFIKQYYAKGAFIPREILVSIAIEDLPAIGAWLSSMSGRKVYIHKPVRGEKRRLAEMAVANAESSLAGDTAAAGMELMEKLGERLRLRRTPKTIEGLDISNLSGEQAVGTMVRFVDGQADRSGYRNYRIKRVQGIDDYGMMAEMVGRRAVKGDLPDLFVVDGGKGHLHAVQKILESAEGEERPAVVAIAKPDETKGEKRDKVYIPGRKNPILLEPNDPILLFLMRIRDEVHRRAILYHRTLRKKAFIVSDLDRVPGIGKMRKRQLLTHFRSINAIARAGQDELSAVPGISSRLAQEIVRFFQES
ncbi:MAG: excinuclease ABC subunit UvrC [Deltaproteobacteria bacterium]|nr:excinuclease ABC subunit UvrC [Deltaproteobacteria bacterium]